MKNAIIVLVILVAGAAAWYVLSERREAGPGSQEPASMAQACEANGGTWNAEVGDCETANEEWCVAAGGAYSECASACRTSASTEAPPDTVCTLQCVAVCRF